MKYFAGVKTVEELRKKYRELLKKYHPDNENRTHSSGINYLGKPSRNGGKSMSKNIDNTGHDQPSRPRIL